MKSILKKEQLFIQEIKELQKDGRYQEPKDIDQKSIDKRVKSRIIQLVCDFDKDDKNITRVNVSSKIKNI